jgi:hypothetical protein
MTSLKFENPNVDLKINRFKKIRINKKRLSKNESHINYKQITFLLFLVIIFQ